MSLIKFAGYVILALIPPTFAAAIITKSGFFFFKNLNTLFRYGYKFIGPQDGEMACGEFGKGKMSSPRQIISYLENFLIVLVVN